MSRILSIASIFIAAAAATGATVANAAGVCPSSIPMYSGRFTQQLTYINDRDPLDNTTTSAHYLYTISPTVAVNNRPADAYEDCPEAAYVSQYAHLGGCVSDAPTLVAATPTEDGCLYTFAKDDTIKVSVNIVCDRTNDGVEYSSTVYTTSALNDAGVRVNTTVIYGDATEVCGAPRPTENTTSTTIAPTDDTATATFVPSSGTAGTTTASPLSTTATPSNDGNGGSSFDTGVIVGIVVGIVGALIVCGGVLYFIRSKRRGSFDDNQVSLNSDFTNTEAVL